MEQKASQLWQMSLPRDWKHGNGGRYDKTIICECWVLCYVSMGSTCAALFHRTHAIFTGDPNAYSVIFSSKMHSSTGCFTVEMWTQINWIPFLPASFSANVNCKMKMR